MNVATVKVGEMVGFDTVVELAKQGRLNYDIQPTPAVALGAYEVTPWRWPARTPFSRTRACT
jgi:penicillin-binding protein 1B